ncbi:glycosyltransferase [uncultured Methylophaga sp.]|uniref:glycosyltransferase n=1 Tax=uncultured Methylophaga sp. TaxID=285271 RepID=UPI00261168AE|nr:glycosyltransferase [uncultured Methylophaga sp.]
MKIAYLVGENLSKHPGLKHKIETQIHYWRSAGHDVYQIHHHNGVVIDPDGKEQQYLVHANDTASKWQRLSRLAKQYHFVARQLEEIKPDLTYSRYLFPAKNLSKIRQHAGRLILEVNSDDRAEYLQKSVLTGVVNTLFRHRVLAKADGLVFVTGELRDKSAFSGLTPHRCVIGNGVEVDSFEFLSRTGNSLPQLVFIGSPGQSWHGLDKVGLLASYFPEWTFNIIGPNKEECLKQWRAEPENIIFHGYLSNLDAQRVVKNMDVGISTLALHRKSMQEACPLKLRQYLAQGIPVLAASEDPDIESEQVFYFRIANTEHNVTSSIDAIRTFVGNVFANSDIRTSARRYAEEHLAASEKEAKRLKFFERVLAL